MGRHTARPSDRLPLIPERDMKQRSIDDTYKGPIDLLQHTTKCRAA